MIRHWTNTFIQVAPDCPATSGVVPVAKRAEKPAHLIQYELLAEYPYRFTFEDLLFEVYIRHKGLSGLAEDELALVREELLGKNHPCLRASMLPKKFGWGFHYNDRGTIALYGMETEKYGSLLNAAKRGELDLFIAIRSSRK